MQALRERRLAPRVQSGGLMSYTDITTPAVPGGPGDRVPGLSRMLSLLGQDPPATQQAIAELKSGLLRGSPDPLDPVMLRIADRIAFVLGDAEQQIAFWTEVDTFIQTELAEAYPNVQFGRGHALFRRALLLIRKEGCYKAALEDFRLAREDDEKHEKLGVSSAADCWYRLFVDYEDFPLYVASLGQADREELFATVDYGWDRGIASAAQDPRAQAAIVALARSGASEDLDDLARLGLLRYRDLVTAARGDAVVSAIANLGFLAELSATALLRDRGITVVKTKRDCCQKDEDVPLARAQLRSLVQAVAEARPEVPRIVLSTLRFVLHLRNRLHLGNEWRQKERLDGGVVPILPHIGDRLVLRCAQALQRTPEDGAAVPRQPPAKASPPPENPA